MIEHHNKSNIVEYSYEAFVSEIKLDAEKCFILTETELEETVYDKEEIEESIRNKKQYCGYFWKRKWGIKQTVLPSGTSTVVEEKNTSYDDFINGIKISNKRDPLEIGIKKIKMQINALFKNNFIVFKSKKGNIALRDKKNRKYIGNFFIDNKSFFEEKLKIIFFYDLKPSDKRLDNISCIFQHFSYSDCQTNFSMIKSKPRKR